MDTRKRGTTPDMQVTSIRLEPELKERLREISGERGYQFLIREVLWQFVEHPASFDRIQSTSDQTWQFLSPIDDALENLEQSPIPPQSSRLSKNNIRAIFRAIAQREECCAITGQLIRPQQTMWLGLTVSGSLISLSNDSLTD
ncbi:MULTISPECIES: hypothetical protein [unclassified Leptolyngbya]|uniref:hypothetical protein n=1 Tax=unclassified Leptolyngbya TaxID=2650499 RepID=UPI001685B339|nr:MULTISPECIES: hypothetical protein [unclassified Leptolyngbya]MBD1910658.1 hypothetical protein [Leptolyngbya sp. FACHB-8]MBD2158419.1 hypothetical protein [Leptolyngbya sp. FACHB-16]